MYDVWSVYRKDDKLSKKIFETDLNLKISSKGSKKWKKAPIVAD